MTTIRWSAMDTEQEPARPAQLRIIARHDEGMFECEVSDNGSGIPAEIMPKMFEPLYSTRSFGIGLGLPLVKQIVEDHGGDISSQSVPDRGTTMTIRLPQVDNRWSVELFSE